MFDFQDAGTLFTLAVIYGAVVIAVFWGALVMWTYRDMRARSRDSLSQILVAVMVAVLTIPGWFIYLMLRPRETLSEAYERSLEEEALLQEIEEKPVCPGCGQRVDGAWQVCPNCHTRLKKACVACRQLLELPWNICPYCATQQRHDLDEDLGLAQLARPTPSPEPRVSLTRQNPDAASTLEFVDDEY